MKLVEKLEDVEVSTQIRVGREWRERGYDLYYIYNLTPNNSIHLTTSFDRELWTGTALVPALYKVWQAGMAEMLKIAGLNPNKVAGVGYFFTRNKHANIWPHTHQILFSTRDRKTGRSIARLTQDQKDEMLKMWQELGGREFYIKRVYDSYRLLSYWFGAKNMLVPGQRWQPLPDFNLELLNQKFRRAA